MANRHAVVTGGAQGIGAAIAQRLLEDGLDVTIWDANEVGLGELSDERLARVVCDQSVPEQVDRALAETLRERSRIDVLVNNAGIMGREARVWEYPTDEWRRVVDVDLLGVFHCCRAVVPAMASNGWGRIVNIASIAGKEGNPGMSAYSAAKAGVIALTKSLGKELATSGVLVNAVAPGLVETPMSASASDEIKALLLAKVPLGRYATTQEIAALVSWLCGDEASYTTASVFDISGGRATY